MRTIGGIMMSLSMLAGLAASVTVALLMWDTLPMMGADVPKVAMIENFRQIGRLF